ncbi:hypothetical protein [uncultured Nostoc sp.]|uniref:hypothetical protein n=1 Tax=uncultured Nostoc sp. TaxID=340711 RepID=UPI0035CAF508
MILSAIPSRRVTQHLILVHVRLNGSETQPCILEEVVDLPELEIRQHQCLPWQATDDLRLVGQSDRGIVFKQSIILSANDSQRLLARRIKVCLEELLRDEDKEIFILTNLPSDSTVGKRYSHDGCFFAVLIAQIYRKRWKLETLFQVLTKNLCCEINTLGYLKAALFAFCIALVAYNVLQFIGRFRGI